MRRPLVAVAVALAAVVSAGCATTPDAPGCNDARRLALVAQSVPGAAYVPCVATLPPGWRVTDFDADDDGTTIALDSDRADREVEVRLAAACDVGGATPTTPRDEGVRTYQRVEAITPRYAGAILDVFPGGCVAYEFEFARGAHIALIDELQRAVGLRSRRDLRQELRDDLGISLDP